MDADDPQLSYVLLAYGRVAGILKQDFLPYLQHVMPDVLRAAQIELKVIVLKGNVTIVLLLVKGAGAENAGREVRRTAVPAGYLTTGSPALVSPSNHHHLGSCTGLRGQRARMPAHPAATPSGK